MEKKDGQEGPTSEENLDKDLGELQALEEKIQNLVDKQMQEMMQIEKVRDKRLGRRGEGEGKGGREEEGDEAFWEYEMLVAAIPDREEALARRADQNLQANPQLLAQHSAESSENTSARSGEGGGGRKEEKEEEEGGRGRRRRRKGDLSW
eukprot:356044-Hanusia_phi.AAC.1